MRALSAAGQSPSRRRLGAGSGADDGRCRPFAAAPGGAAPVGASSCWARRLPGGNAAMQLGPWERIRWSARARAAWWVRPVGAGGGSRALPAKLRTGAPGAGPAAHTRPALGSMAMRTSTRLGCGLGRPLGRPPDRSERAGYWKRRPETTEEAQEADAGAGRVAMLVASHRRRRPFLVWVSRYPSRDRNATLASA